MVIPTTPRRAGGRRVAWIGAAVVALAAAIAVGALARRPVDPDRLFREARAALDAGQSDRAQQIVNRLARLRAPGPFDRLLRAQVAEARGRPDDAVAELDAVADSHPLAPVARVLAGQIEVKRYRLRAAEAQFLRAVAREPKAVQAHRELSYLYNIQQRQDELDRELNALSELNELTVERLVHWGKTRNVVWKPDRDCEELAKFLAADPDDRLSRLALAEGLRRLDRRDEAERVLAPLPASDPDARARRALIALDRGDIGAVESLLAGGPADHPLLAKLRGQLAISRGDFPAAVAHLRRAYRADPTDRAVQQGLGSALRRTGDEVAAGPLLAAARRHDALTPLISRASSPEAGADPALPAKLGAACEAAGRLYEARAWYKIAVARDPLDRPAQQSVFRLGRLIDARAAAARDRPANPAG